MMDDVFKDIKMDSIYFISHACPLARGIPVYESFWGKIWV
jgi:hypothetical protein